MQKSSIAFVMLAACGSADRSGAVPDSGSGSDSGGGSGSNASYIVYAHSDHVLYSIDLGAKRLIKVGDFNAPNNDVITDLAVAPSGTIYTISNTTLYTASAADGHVTKVGSLSTCGQQGVALTTTSDGRIWVGDYMGAICQIDVSGAAPVLKPPVQMQGGYALSGDVVGVDNGTVFGSAYKLDQQSTQDDNILVTVNVDTGAVTAIGATGYPKLFGVAFQDNQVFGFTHDGTGRVVTIDTASGQGTMFGTFKDPATNMGISFAGAGVSSLVVIE